MSDTFTESSPISASKRIRNAISGVILAPLALLGSVGLLFWNEGNVVRTAQSLDEGEGQVVSVAADTLDPANQGKLIYVTGSTAVDGKLRDAEFGIEEPAIKLLRIVEMYQWTEEKKTRKSGNRRETTYDYERKWQEGSVNSQSFHRSGHENPGHTPFSSHTEIAERVTLGAFVLNDLQIAQTDQGSNRKARSITNEEFAALPEAIQRDAEHREGGLYLPVSRWLAHAPKDRVNEKFQPAGEAGPEKQPQVGDVRVKFVAIHPGPTSVVGKQTATGFEPFPTKAGKPVFLFRTETVAVHDMFERARADNSMWAWILRGIGVLIMFIGFLMLTGLITALADWIPVLGGLVSGGMFLLALAGTVVTGGAVIAVAWLFYHPLYAIAALVVALALAGALWFLFRRKPPAVQHPSGLEIVS